jgi:hypothetical protein
MTTPDEVDDGPPRERCIWCDGDPQAFSACCTATEIDETIWVDSEGNA